MGTAMDDLLAEEDPWRSSFALKLLWPDSVKLDEATREAMLADFFSRAPHPIYYHHNPDDPVGVAHKCSGLLTMCRFSDTSFHGRLILSDSKNVPWSGCLGAQLLRTQQDPDRYIIVSLGFIDWEPSRDYTPNAEVLR